VSGGGQAPALPDDACAALASYFFTIPMRTNPAGPPLAALRVLATLVFALALPVFLVTSGVRWVALGEGFYLEEFARHRVGQTTGLSNAELTEVARAFITYFQMPAQRMEGAVALPASRGPLLNERELAHMADVQLLIHRVFDLWGAALVALVGSAVAIVIARPATGGRALVRAGALGGALAVLAVGAVAAASLLDFSQLFLRFHLASFSNDLWMLDPARDRLIQLFPLGFFFDAAIRIAVQTVAIGAIITAVSLAALRQMR